MPVEVQPIPSTELAMELDPGEALAEFKQGLSLLKNRYPEEALQHLKRAAEIEKNNPFYISYFGLALAMSRRKWADAEQLCHTALKIKRGHPQLYLNLAEVYVQAGRREDAFETLSAGLRYNHRDPRLRMALGRLGFRRSPVLPFLGRGHFLNRSLGRLRHRVVRRPRPN